ncbi:MAG: hypothetical protein ACI8QW_000318, partial [Saprospiraceae bacterium]
SHNILMPYVSNETLRKMIHAQPLKVKQ